MLSLKNSCFSVDAVKQLEDNPSMRIPKRSTQPEEGAALSAWRQRSGIKQSELAKRAGLSQNLICLLEAGKRNFTKDSGDKIYRAMKEFDAERAERLTAVALNRDSRTLEIQYLQRKGASNQEREQLVSMLIRENELLRSQLEGSRQTTQQQIGPLIAEASEVWMERNIKPLTAEITELRNQLADMHRLLALKADAVGKEAQAQDLQEQIEQRVKKNG
jgi:transcriptional regulator with XRE-family HTH domain